MSASLRMSRAPSPPSVAAGVDRSSGRDVLVIGAGRWSGVGWTATALLYYGLWAMAGRSGA